MYISCLALDAVPVEYSFTVTIFVGLRPAATNIGQRYSHTRWEWHTTVQHEYSKEADFIDIPLPSYDGVLATMVPGEYILTVQLATPHHTQAWLEPGQVVVPMDVITGLGDLLDSTSGDVQFVCLEHTLEEDGRMVSRKRVVYAHGEVLRARSDYFKGLLDGGFKETEGTGRRTVVVDDANFDTVYWLLR